MKPSLLILYPVNFVPLIFLQQRYLSLREINQLLKTRDSGDSPYDQTGSLLQITHFLSLFRLRIVIVFAKLDDVLLACLQAGIQVI